jgi:type VI secretion system protein ImpA
MASPETIDFDRLLSPISEDQPSGVNPRQDMSPDAPYRKLKDTRQRVRNAERQIARGESPGDDFDIGREWRTLYDGGLELLASQAKDYEVTAWLIEALLRQHGVAGLRDGLRLAREMAEKFWDTMYPEEDEEDGMLLRVAGLRGLFGDEAGGTLIAPIGAAPLTNSSDGVQLSYYDYQLAEQLESVEDPERRAKRIAEGAITLEQYEAAARATDPAHFDQLLEDIAACLQELDLLSSVLDERCPPLPDGEHVSPSIANPREILRSCERTIRIYHEPVSGIGEEQDSVGDAGDGAPAGASGTGGGVSVGVGEIASREEAFRVLLRVADYFKRTEPHSPLSYTLEQSVRWGGSRCRNYGPN